VEDDSHSAGSLRDGMCGKHYVRVRRYGDPYFVKPRGGTQPALEERLLAKINKNGPLPEQRPELGPCWVWTGAKQGSGYGKVTIRQRGLGAHVAVYELYRKPVPEGMELDHLCHPGDGSCARATCRHRLCVNPDHLDPTTRFVNMKRGNTFTAANLAKTHCPKGHEYTLENTRVRIAPSGNPMRSCKQCHRDAHAPTGKINPMIAANAAKTHCPKGHEYTPENTIIDLSVGGKNGGRRCRACRREARLTPEARAKMAVYQRACKERKREATS
jgi:hypothetical protein